MSGATLALLGVAGSWLHILATLALAGVANALILVGTYVLIAEHVPGRPQGLAFGAKQAAIPTACFGAGALVVLLLFFQNWRLAVIGIGLATLAISPLLIRFPRTYKRSAEGEAHVGRPSRPWLLAATAGLGSAATTSLPTSFVASAIVSGYSAGLAGVLQVLIAIVIMTGSVGLLLIAWVEPVPLFAVAAVASFLGTWGWAGMLWLRVARTRGRNPRSIAFVQSGMLTGGVRGPLVSSVVTKVTGFQPAWLFLAATLLLAAVVLGRSG